MRLDIIMRARWVSGAALGWCSPGLANRTYSSLQGPGARSLAPRRNMLFLWTLLSASDCQWTTRRFVRSVVLHNVSILGIWQ
jgi:hypothetical protein